VGVIWSRHVDRRRVLSLLAERFGPVTGEKMDFPFTSDTAYYEREMGDGLSRSFIFFERIVPQDTLAEIKRETMAMEDGFREGKRRTINLDPGFLAMDKLVLATGKEYAHRICLDGGIHAEVELLCRDGRMRSLEWTYPDYRTAEALDFFDRARLDLREALRKERGEDPGK
jgi:hypothetical protein